MTRCKNKDKIEEFSKHATQEEVKTHRLYSCLKCVGAAYDTCVEFEESNGNYLNNRRTQQTEDLRTFQQTEDLKIFLK